LKVIKNYYLCTQVQSRVGMSYVLSTLSLPNVHFYCVCQIRIFYAINPIVTDMGQGTDRDIYHVHWSVPRPLGSMYILILPSITVISILITLLCVSKILCNYNTHVRNWFIHIHDKNKFTINNIKKNLKQCHWDGYDM
jgi:hypothetical protein